METTLDRQASAPLVPDITAPSRARFAAFAIGFGLGASLLIHRVLLPGADWTVLALLASMLMTLSSLTAMLVFRQIQLPLEAAHAVLEEQALQLQMLTEPPVRHPAAAAAPVAAPEQEIHREIWRPDPSEEAVYQRHCRELLIADHAEPVLLMRPDGRIDALNAAAAGVIAKGIPDLHEQLLTGSFPLFDNTQAEPLQHPLSTRLQQLFDGGRPDEQSFDALLERRGRTSVQLRLRCRPILGPGQQVRLLMLSMHDIRDLAGRSFAQATVDAI